MTQEKQKNAAQGQPGAKKQHKRIKLLPAFWKTKCAGCGKEVSGMATDNVCGACRQKGIVGRQPTRKELIDAGLWKQCEALGCHKWFRGRDRKQRFCCEACGRGERSRLEIRRYEIHKYNDMVEEMIKNGSCLCPFSTGMINPRNGFPAEHANNCPFG